MPSKINGGSPIHRFGPRLEQRAVAVREGRLRRISTFRSTPRIGFTLIEILVVIVMIAILATLVAPNVFRHVGTAKDATARAQIEMLGAALDAYRLDNGRYPTSEQGLSALWQQPTSEPRPASWRGPYLRKDVPLDPWNHAYVYKQPAEQSRTGYDLLSLGADGQPGGSADDADITSWK
jgi:general secretion pathway protein G